MLEISRFLPMSCRLAPGLKVLVLLFSDYLCLFLLTNEGFGAETIYRTLALFWNHNNSCSKVELNVGHHYLLSTKGRGARE